MGIFLEIYEITDNNNTKNHGDNRNNTTQNRKNENEERFRQ